MAEQTFRSPGFFEQEIDLVQRVQTPTGTPAAIAGTAQKGPAFVPVTVGSFADFRTKFGDLNSKQFGPYAVNEFLKQRDAVTYVRVLGAGANETDADIQTTVREGTVKNAGFKLAPTTLATGIGSNTRKGEIAHFLAARHFVSASEVYGYPIFTNNDSFGTSKYVNLVRGVIFTTSDARAGVLSASFQAGKLTEEDATQDFLLQGGDNLASIGSSGEMDGKFKIFISSSNSTFANTDGVAGVKVFTASLNPRNEDYIRNILNTNPDKFEEEKHLLYAAFDVPAELAAVSDRQLNLTDAPIAMMSGSSFKSSNNPAAQDFATSYGRFDTRYSAPRTTSFISQPYGNTEFDLFSFELLDDGATSGGKYKISIANIRASSDENNPYGTFNVQVRLWNDSDKTPEILEEYVNCDLNPNSEKFVGRMIGDKKVSFNFDAASAQDRKLTITGRYPNRSNIVRVVLSDDVVNSNVPRDCLPFGFKGIPVLKTNDALNDFDPVESAGGSAPTFSNTTLGRRVASRLGVHHSASLMSHPEGPNNVHVPLTASIVPPIPLTFKATSGKVADGTIGFVGQPGTLETSDNRIYWGAKTTRIAPDKTVQPTGFTDTALQSNLGDDVNLGLKDLCKFIGIEKLDNLVTGSGADELNNNKFSLAYVAFGNRAGGGEGSATGLYQDTELTGTVDQHMLDAAYIRDAGTGGRQDNSTYTINDGTMTNRISFATILNQTSSVTFNRFTDYMKFTNVFYGGFDGVNILDKNASRLNDKSSSEQTGGGASNAFVSPGLSTNMAGTGKNNNTVASYKAAINLLTDETIVNSNILAVPGIREPLITDHALDRNLDYGKSIYLMDLPEFDSSTKRLYGDTSTKASVAKTVTQAQRRRLDNSFAAAYFPDVVIQDDTSGKNVRVPASIAALSALGFNDKNFYPWFAPAGFNRGALSSVRQVDVRLTAGDRDTLYDARINPIATFPGSATAGGSRYVIFGQKTLQLAKSALDRVNVRRLVLEVKRIVSQASNNFLFENNTPALRAKFVAQISPLLAVVQSQSGVEQFRVVCDDSNNTPADVESNKLNGQIVIVPTRSIEFISIDFVITNAGVSFE